MKKLFLFLLPVALMPSITACQDTAHSIVAINRCDESITRIELITDQFTKLMESGQQFVVEFYSPYCVHCEELNPILDQYVSKTNKMVYSLDLTKYTRDELEELQMTYPSVFPDLLVPAIRFIENKTLTYDVSSNKFSSYTALKSIMDKHFFSSNIYYSETYGGYENYINHHNSYVLFSYNLNSEKSLDIASTNLVTKSVANSKKNVLLLNLIDLEQIQYTYNIDYDSFIVLVEDSQVKKIANYTDSDFSIDDFIL